MVVVEKVKAALRTHGKRGAYACEEDLCPYFKSQSCGSDLADDALVVIEAQEKHIQ